MSKETKIFILSIIISQLVFIKVFIPLMFWLLNQDFVIQYLGIIAGAITYIIALIIFNHINRCLESKN